MPVKCSVDSLASRVIPVLVAFLCVFGAVGGGSVSGARAPAATVLAAHVETAPFANELVLNELVLNELVLNTSAAIIGEQAALGVKSGEIGHGSDSERNRIVQEGTPGDDVPGGDRPEDEPGEDERDTDLEDEPSPEQDDAAWWQGLATGGPSAVTLLSFHHTSSGRSVIRSRVPRPS
jgi:hypothetical protein